MTEPGEDHEQSDPWRAFPAESPELWRALRGSWARRPVALDRAQVSERYARFYAPLAVVATVLGVMPIFNSVVTVDGRTVKVDTYGSLFDMAGRYSGDPAVVAIGLLAVLVTLLVVASVRGARSPALPLALAVVAALLVIMLLTKPGTGQPTPELSGAGTAGLVVGCWIVVLGVVHAIHLTRVY
jgi:hypothetical protein